MEKMDNKELMQVNGGGVKGTVLGVVGAVVCFAIGFMSGFTRPSTCKSGK